jgi:hypothetical protein
VAVAVTLAGSVRSSPAVDLSLCAWFVGAGAVFATLAWFSAGGRLVPLVVEQRPMLGAATCVIAYALFAAVFRGTTQTLWPIVVGAAVGACSGGLVAAVARAGAAMFRLRLDRAPRGHVNDPVDAVIWSPASGVALFCGLLRAVSFFTTLMRG